jgi:hypothetical protein
VQGRRSDLALPVSIALTVSGFNPGRRDWPSLLTGSSGKLAGKSALIDFKTWYRTPC